MHDDHADNLKFDRRLVREQLTRLPGSCPPPFDFDELQRRAGPAAPVRHVRHGSPLPLGVAALGGLLIVLLLWRQFPGPPAPGDPAGGAADAALRIERPVEGPALVRVDARAAAGVLEDRIAWMDDLLSESRVQGMQEEGVAALEHRRSQLLASLQKVHYAEELMNR